METFEYKGTRITVRYWDPRKNDPSRLFPITPKQMASVIYLEYTGTISRRSAKELIASYWKEGRLRWLAEDVIKDRVRIVEDIDAQ